MSPTNTPLSSRGAYDALSEHPRFKYRGCAPDPDDPTLASGSQELADGTRVRVPVTAWQAPDVDGGERPQERIAREAAAIDVCVECPIMMACHTYANTPGPDGKLVEEFAVLGGERWQARTRRLVKARSGMAPAAAPDVRFTTDQKKDLLYALARHTDPWDVATVANMDLRTANWQRSSLVRLLGLPKSASRNEFLERALERGLVDAKWVRLDDGSVPAVARDMRTTADPKPAPLRTRGPRPGRAKFKAIAGQLELPLPPTVASSTVGRSLPSRTAPASSASLEAAA
ncbi:hypothetical protein ACFW9D_05735 [Streptomyces sp. NPDC059524]|uniref:hypothetical protein n=1 Tax=Streptomyces sp. NPDC059524 TaxID=3346856 RepID=UPI00369DB97B